MRLAAAAAFTAALGFAGAPPAPAQDSRLYGNIPFAVDLASRRPPQFHFTAQHIGEDSNLLAVHMDWYPIPWRELSAGVPPPAVWSAEMQRIAALKRELGLPVYLALTPIGAGDRLKPQAFQLGTALAGDDSFGKPCEPIGSRADYADLRRAYHALVEGLVAVLEPRFLALSIEVNSYAAACPAAWPDMKRFLNDEYALQKAEHPNLVVFHTFQVENLWQASSPDQPCFGWLRDCLVRNFEPLADLRTDLAALSVYPIAPFDNGGRTLPWDYLSVFRALFDRPVAVSETGWPSSTISGQVGDVCFPGLPSSDADQSAWMDRLLAEAETLRMPFVVWWSDDAPLSFESLRPCRCADATPSCAFLNSLASDDERMGFRFFGLMGLRDLDGMAQPTLAAWKRAVARANGRAPISPPVRGHRPGGRPPLSPRGK